eukprot:645311-Amorphochlora_amoeboformis.AAC.1
MGSGSKGNEHKKAVIVARDRKALVFASDFTISTSTRAGSRATARVVMEHLQNSPEILIRASNGRQHGYFGKCSGVSGEGWGQIAE